MLEADITQLTREEKHLRVERLIVRYPHFNHIISQLNHCLKFSKIFAEPECILITGDRGAGKTTIMNTFASEYPRQITHEGITVPILKARVPAPASPKSLVTSLLDALGDPNSAKGSTTVQTIRLKKLLIECSVEMILLDEFHQFIDRDSYAILYGAADWLKNLIDDTKLPFALFGLGYSSVILTANEQLERRFSIREKIAPFVWKLPNKTAQNEPLFFKFLKHLDNGLPFNKSSNLNSVEMAFRIYYATEGVVGFIMKLIRRAAFFAIEDDLESLNLKVLAKAYAERLAHRDLKRKNPFTVAIENLRLQDIDLSKKATEKMPSVINLWC